MNLKTILLTNCFILLSYFVKAQDVEQNIRMVKPFTADGNSNEWNEPLSQYNNDTKLAFALANDDKNLYIIIESLDPITTRSVLFGGITININTAGKKKNAINLTFPFRDRPEGESERQRSGDFTAEHSKPVQGEYEAQKTEQQSVKVSGFKNIKDGILKADNVYGFTSGMSVKKNQDLIYEISIPLSQLQVNVDWEKAIAYNIKLNLIKKSGGERGKGESLGGGQRGGGQRGGGGGGGQHGGGGRGGQRGGGGGGGQRTPQDSSNSENLKSDFWIKYKLVKA